MGCKSWIWLHWDDWAGPGPKKILPSLSLLLFLPWSRYVLYSKCIRPISRSISIFSLRQTFKPGNVATHIKGEFKSRKRNSRWRRKKSAGCLSHCHCKTTFQHSSGRKWERAGTYQDVQSRLLVMPTPPFSIHHLSKIHLKSNPTCGATVQMPETHLVISSFNLCLVICILKHPWLLFSSLLFTHLIHFQTANISHFCFCFARLNKSFPSSSYCKAGSLFCWFFSLPFSASDGFNSPFCRDSGHNYMWYWN